MSTTAERGQQEPAGRRRRVQIGSHQQITRSPNHPTAFSLIEVMVVLVIIGLLAGTATIGVRSYLVSAKRNTAKMEIATIVQGLETYYTVYDRYPSNDEGLEVLTQASEKIPEPLLSRIPNDPWGRPYQYNQPGRDGPYEVICFGADGREGGEPGSADADISSSQLQEER